MAAHHVWCAQFYDGKGEREMKGRFVSYDESSGEVTIKAEKLNSATSINDLTNGEVLQGVTENLYGYSEAATDENYYLIVPEEQRRQMSIKPGGEVDFDLVKEGSKLVKSMRF